MTTMDPTWMRAGAQALTTQWLSSDPDQSNDALAKAVIAAVEPLIRGQIATEIEAADPRLVPHAEPSGWWQGFTDAQGIAARIARGGAQ